MSINAIAAETLTVTAADITADAITTEKATETDAAMAVIRSNTDVASAGVHLGGIAGSL